jgi:methionyl-tRNA formyltransferase
MGEVVEVDGEGFTVACADGRIKILRVKPADGAKAAAGEFAAATKLATGTRFA